MNDLTKEGLRLILNCHPDSDILRFVHGNDSLCRKVREMIDNDCDNKESEIFSCYTALAVDDNFFCKQQHMTSDDLLPAIHELVYQLDGMIKSSGMYALKLKLVKLK